MSHRGGAAWWRRRPSAALSAVAGGAAAVAVALALLVPSLPGEHRPTSVRLGEQGPTAIAPPYGSTTAGTDTTPTEPGGPSTSTGAATTTAPTAPTTTAPTVAAAPPAAPPATAAPGATAPTPPASSTLSGRVLTSTGSPVAGAYLIGLNTLTVHQAASDGSFTIPCPGEPLVASSWLLPLIAPGNHPSGYVRGRDTTNYPPVPASASAGYTFTGGPTLAAAAAPACTGAPITLALPPVATVTVLMGGSGGAGSPGSGSVDGVELPALDPQAALDTAPVTGGQQTLGGLATGTLTIEAADRPLTCTGPGVAPDPVVLGATVDVRAGQRVTISCHT